MNTSAHGGDAPLSTLDGIGPARASALARLGLRTVRDMALFVPIRLESGARATQIAGLLAERARSAELVRVRGFVRRTSLARFGRRSTFRAHIEDDSGSITVVFFNQPWLQKSFVVGVEIEVEGRLATARETVVTAVRGFVAGRSQADERAWRPIYALASGLSQELVAKLVRSASELVVLEELVPRAELDRAGVLDFALCPRELHQPASADSFRAARRRVALERWLELRSRIEARRLEPIAAHAVECRVSDDERLRGAFGFEWTSAQVRCGDEIRSDVGRSRAMRRLLQGDVGSGKTALGLYAAALAARAGAQAAFLAPTEILAEQHFAGARAWCERLGLRAGLVTGSLRAAERRATLESLARGSIDLVFGTHALFSADVRYARLGVAVIDEQHRFGVAQRARLVDKGLDVHVLLMSATPIPRTLALALYGDLDVSVVDEMPRGRGRVVTCRVRDVRALERALVAEVESGGRLFWIVPRIGEESEPARSASEMGAEERYERLLQSPLSARGVELVHGRLDRTKRMRAMERFQRGEVRTLVATTVVEVGVDVREATAMVIEGVERLGLAQLHQLRGRIGRGERDSTCWLIGSESALERCQILEGTCDGFEIAEADLARRGMGDLSGVRQAGPNLEGLSEMELNAELIGLAQRLLRDEPALAQAYRARAADAKSTFSA